MADHFFEYLRHAFKRKASCASPASLKSTLPDLDTNNAYLHEFLSSHSVSVHITLDIPDASNATASVPTSASAGMISACFLSNCENPDAPNRPYITEMQYILSKENFDSLVPLSKQYEGVAVDNVVCAALCWCSINLFYHVSHRSH